MIWAHTLVFDAGVGPRLIAVAPAPTTAVDGACVSDKRCAHVAADGAGQTVSVTCTGVSDDFSVTLTAEAGSTADCKGSDFDTAYVVVGSRPDVTITPVSNTTSFCVSQGDTLTFTYTVSSGAANTPLVVAAVAPQQADCRVTNPSGSTGLAAQHARWRCLLRPQHSVGPLKHSCAREGCMQRCLHATHAGWH
jgi:hypothetical protein